MNLNTISLLLLSISFFSCEKGETGPQGPQGNANVQSVVTYVDSFSWNLSHHIYYTDLGTVGIITPPIVYNGTIQVFLQSDTLSSEWLNLPWTETHPGFSLTYNFSYSLNGVLISVTNSDSTVTANPGDHAFKVVAISL